MISGQLYHPDIFTLCPKYQNELIQKKKKMTAFIYIIYRYMNYIFSAFLNKLINNSYFH